MLEQPANSQMARPIQILDGGMSRELMRLEAPFKQPEWSAYALMEAPHFVEQVHRDFAAAGADILTTCSYALVPFHIGEQRFRARGEQLAALAGRLARTVADETRKATGRRMLVAGSLPPVFGSYQPDMFDANRVQEYLSVLVRGLAPYVDVWLGETLSLVAEAEAVAVALKDQQRREPLWISFNLADESGGDATRAGSTLRSGEPVADAVSRVLDFGAEAVLFNCNRPELMGAAVIEAKRVIAARGSDVSIGVYANAFEPRSEDYAANEHVAATRSDLQSHVYAALACEWIENGARIVGGCCGIGSEHIRELAQTIKMKYPQTDSALAP